MTKARELRRNRLNSNGPQTGANFPGNQSLQSVVVHIAQIQDLL